MATDAVTGNGGMHRTGKPGGLAEITGGFMTDAAIIGRRDMIGRFTDGNISVVTVRTAIDDSRVIERRVGKVGGVVAHGTILSRGQMRGYFTHGNDSVVARRAVVNHAGMIIGAAGEGTRCMAVTAIRAGWKVHMMIGRLNRTSISAPIMTGITPVTHYVGTGMINELRGKGIRMVAVAAIALGVGMIGHSLLASGDGAVVAA